MSIAGENGQKQSSRKQKQMPLNLTTDNTFVKREHVTLRNMFADDVLKYNEVESRLTRYTLFASKAETAVLERLHDPTLSFPTFDNLVEAIKATAEKCGDHYWTMRRLFNCLRHTDQLDIAAFDILYDLVANEFVMHGPENTEMLTLAGRKLYWMHERVKQLMTLRDFFFDDVKCSWKYATPQEIHLNIVLSGNAQWLDEDWLDENLSWLLMYDTTKRFKRLTDPIIESGLYSVEPQINTIHRELL